MFDYVFKRYRIKIDFDIAFKNFLEDLLFMKNLKYLIFFLMFSVSYQCYATSSSLFLAAYHGDNPETLKELYKETQEILPTDAEEEILAEKFGYKNIAEFEVASFIYKLAITVNNACSSPDKGESCEGLYNVYKNEGGTKELLDFIRRQHLRGELIADQIIKKSANKPEINYNLIQ